ncbi:hypothetical protein EV401DRAFT_403196 [Pisolithus croceorrhizus]|nr:hypothetical protein EV401DRAFT_403196 [Pisolithus croceorrhizus]
MCCRYNDEQHVVVVVGRTGVGVSSLVNLLAGYPVSQKSPDAKQRTRRVQEHPNISVRERYVYVCEIPGFGGDIKVKDNTLINYVQSLHAHRGIDLVLYCMRPMKETLMPQTFKQLQQNLHGVPFVAVVTGLEHYPGTMEQWWSMNESRIKAHEMTFEDHVCVTTLPEAEIAYNDTLRKRRDKSGSDVETLVYKYCGGTKVQGTGGVCWRLTAGLGLRAAICAH